MMNALSELLFSGSRFRVGVSRVLERPASVDIWVTGSDYVLSVVSRRDVLGGFGDLF